VARSEGLLDQLSRDLLSEPGVVEARRVSQLLIIVRVLELLRQCGHAEVVDVRERRKVELEGCAAHLSRAGCRVWVRS